MNQNNSREEEGWEKKFEEQFVPMPDWMVGKAFDAEAVAEFNKARLRIKEFIHQELQKARHDWLREEIVKLEGMKKDEVKWKKAKYDVKSVDAVIYNHALQTIIDRYQSELDQPDALTK